MGSDKSLLELSGTPLLTLAARRVGAVCGRVSVVGDPARYSGFGMQVVPDRFPGAGPLAGIEAALRSTDADWNLIVACDMPALDPAILESLFAAAITNGVDCAVPRYPDGKLEPVCAVYHRRCHAPILAAVEDGIRKVADAFLRLAVKHAITYVPVSSPASFANLNTPEELRRYRDG
jgi:molybdopterin-guanine dinucleotide biosynthesis protein A